jgi:hypothetical protein
MTDMTTTTERTYGPWHIVKVVTDTRWDGFAFHTGPVYYVGHPAECGWSEDDADVCTFEDVLGAHDHKHNDLGDFEARAWAEQYGDYPDDGDDGLEWRPAGDNPR